MKKKMIALASAMIVSVQVPSRATSSCSALATTIPAGEERDRAPRLEPRAGDPDRDVERQHPGAVRLHDGQDQGEQADRREQVRGGRRIDVARPVDHAEGQQDDEGDEDDEDDQAVAVQRRLRVRLQRGRHDQDPEDHGEERQHPAHVLVHGANDRPRRARGHRRAGGTAAQPGGGGRLVPGADDGSARAGPACDPCSAPSPPPQRSPPRTPPPSPSAGSRSATATSRRSAASTSTSGAARSSRCSDPNGAGKTSTIEVLEGFRAASGGSVEVLDADPWNAARDWRDRIGIVLQESAPELGLTVRECLRLYAGYYTAPRDVDETIALVGLAEQAGRRGDEALRRPAPPARRRARARRRPRADLPRRADDRLRPGRAPRRVGGRHRPARARQDDPAHHALHGGGRAARRPDRRHGPRRDRRGGHARDARRARPRRRRRHVHAPARRRTTPRSGSSATRTAASRCAPSGRWPTSTS